MKAAALQETKWLGSVMYCVGDSIILAAGRPVPTPGEHLQRGERVALMLMGAWREAGEQWKAWSLRLVSTKKKGETLHLMSCYALTQAASRTDKSKFYDDLQQVLATIPSNEPYIMLGDFNAHAGSREKVGELYGSKVPGPHGCGECNDAGQELLAFLSYYSVQHMA